jgi:hypothetical protein
MIAIAIIGLEELTTITALPSSGLGTHDELPALREENAKSNPNRLCRAKKKKKEQEL